MANDGVDPADIDAQRQAGWPDFHPEDHCHRCGRPNIKAWNSPEWVGEDPDGVRVVGGEADGAEGCRRGCR